MLTGIKLGTRLLGAFFLIATFSSLVTTAVYIYFFSERIENDAVETMGMRAREAQLAYQREADGLAQTARFFANSPSIRNFTLFSSAPQLEEFLKTLIGTESFDQIVVYGAQRQPLAEAHNASAKPVADRQAGVADMPVHRVFHLGEARIGIERLYTSNGIVFAITAAAPIHTRTVPPKTAGAVLLRRLFNDNASLLQSMRGHFDGSLTLYSERDAIASTSDDSRLKTLDPTEREEILGRENGSVIANFDAGGFLAGYIRLAVTDSEDPLILGVHLPADRFVELTRQAMWQLLGVMSLCILVAVVLAWVLTRNLLHPVRRLMIGVEQVTSGNLEYVIVADRQDELGELARAFNSMSRQLREFFEVLHATVDTLTRVGTALSAEKNLDRLLDTLVSEARKVSNANDGALYSVSGDLLARNSNGGNEAHAKTPASLSELERALFSHVAASRELFYADRSRPLPQELAPVTETAPPRAQILAPLLDHGNQTVGMLQLSDPVDPRSGLESHFTRNQIEIVRSLASQAAVAIENARNYERIERQNRVFSRFVPTEFLSHLGRKELGEVRLGDAVEERLVVFFADIRAFTSFSESLAPQEIFSFLNDYLNTIGPAISRNTGFIDKYIGDAVMALFSDGKSAADNALRAALEIRAALRQFNIARLGSGSPPLEIGIGMHFGPVTLGTIGFKERMESTVIGDSVNLASRIESLTKFYGIRIGISDDLLGVLQDPPRASLREVDRVLVRGRSQQTVIYEVLDEGDQPPILDAQNGLGRYREALALYKNGDWALAEEAFSELASTIPNDSLVQFHHRRCRQFRKAPPDSWSGATVFRS